MFLGKVILAVEEFVRLVSMRDYVAAAALGERVDVASFREALSAWDWMLDDIGEMPPEGWRGVWVQRPMEGSEGAVAFVDVPVWSRNGENMDWWLKFALIPGPGEGWRIDYVTPSN